MGKIAFFTLIGLIALVAMPIVVSYLIVYWRDTRRRWRLEDAEDKRRLSAQIREDLEKELKEN